MKKVLVNISWKMRKTHTRINLFDLYINDSWEGWGFDILNIRYNGKMYSLFKLLLFLPNGAERNFVYVSGDFLFLRNKLLKTYDKMLDMELWNSKSFSKFDKLKLDILKFIFK